MRLPTSLSKCPTQPLDPLLIANSSTCSRAWSLCIFKAYREFPNITATNTDAYSLFTLVVHNHLEHAELAAAPLPCCWVAGRQP